MRINQALIKCCLLSNKTIECALLLWCDDDDDDVYTLSVQLVTSSRYKSHSANLVVENPSEDWWATSRFTPMLFFEMANQSFRDCPKCHVNHRHNSCFDLLQFPQFSCQVLIFSIFSFSFSSTLASPGTATLIIWQAACRLFAGTRSALLHLSYYYYHYCCCCCCFRKPIIVIIIIIIIIIVFENKRGIRVSDGKEK